MSLNMPLMFSSTLMCFGRSWPVEQSVEQRESEKGDQGDRIN